MANVCYNWIQAFGDAKVIEKIEKELMMDEDMYSLEHIHTNGGEITFSCESRWAPPADWLEENSKEFGVIFECEYSEGGSDIAGKLSYKNGEKIMDIDFPYLEGKYNFMDWFEFIEMDVIHRLDEDETFEDFIGQFYFCTEDEIKELTELYHENAE
jgi:hypothetical protein